ncbi:hypothetical protein [Streptomyces sp. UG1]|uniref:hypothetical protein n=1 Tax=Streptomyces sp. UG1 TaxID=3417652 RepID=UPI003CE6C529
MDGESDGRQRQLGVLGQMISDDGELLVMAFVHVGNSEGGTAGAEACVRAKVLLSHREGLFFLGDQALVRDGSPDGGRLLCAVVRRVGVRLLAKIDAA